MITRWALLISISKYRSSDDFIHLDYADVHIDQLASILNERGGFDKQNIIKIPNEGKSTKPTRNDILQEYNKIITNLSRGDFLLIYFIGHGGEIGDEICIFPMDAYTDYSPDNTILQESSILISTLIKLARRNEIDRNNDVLILLDICRDKMSQSSSIDTDSLLMHEKTISKFPSGLSFIFSSMPGQKSYSFKDENDNLNSIFSFSLIETLKRNQTLTIASMIQETKERMSKIITVHQKPPQELHVKFSGDNRIGQIRILSSDSISIDEKNRDVYDFISNIFNFFITKKIKKGELPSKLLPLVDNLEFSTLKDISERIREFSNIFGDNNLIDNLTKELSAPKIVVEKISEIGFDDILVLLNRTDIIDRDYVRYTTKRYSKKDLTILRTYLNHEETSSHIKTIVFSNDKELSKSVQHRFLGEGFNQSYSMTIGADFSIKRMKLLDYECVIQHWILESQLRFSSVREVYYQDMNSIIYLLKGESVLILEDLYDMLTELVKIIKKINFPIYVIVNYEKHFSMNSIEAYLKKLSDEFSTNVYFFTFKDILNTQLSDQLHLFYLESLLNLPHIKPIDD